MIFSFGTFEKVNLYKDWHLFEMSNSRDPDMLKGGLAPLGDTETAGGDDR